MNWRNAYKVALSGLLALAIVTIISINDTFATASTLTLSIDASTVTVNLAPNNANGTFNKSTASNLSASTTNATGYTLSIAAPSGAGADYDKLVNSSDNTAKLSSISSVTSEEQFKALNGTAYNNMWGYLPSRYCINDVCSNNTSFLPAPTTTGDIIDQTTAANTTANTYTIALGARIDSTAKTGSYTNSFVVRLVANAIPYTITYDDSVVSNMPTDVSSTSADQTVPISSNIPVRAGYTFLGWCTVVPTNNNGTDECTGGTTYQPSAALTIDQTGTGNNFHLYAMWKEEKTIANSTYLQEVNACPASLTTGQVYTIKDSRDNQDYNVAKLADGKCWMVENLNLAGGTALSSIDSDVSSGYIDGFTTGNGLTKVGDTIVLPVSSVSGFDTDNYSNVYNSGNKTSNCNSPGCYSYYSWDAATLGSGRTINDADTDAPYSVCPKGWRLPTASSSVYTEELKDRSDWYKLAIQYGLSEQSGGAQSSNAFYQQAGPGTIPNLLINHEYRNGSYNGNEYVGNYWSSTSYDSDEAVHLHFYSSFVSVINNYHRYSGFGIRCVYRGD